MKVKWPLVRRTVLELTRPVLIALGRLHMPPHYRTIEAEAVNRLMMDIKPGDVLLSRRNRETTNFLIPGHWKHAAMYIGEGRVIEAVGRGVVESSLLEFCTTKDSVVCLRSTFCSTADAELAVVYAKKLRGMPYDYLVEHDQSMTVNLAFYCSEVIWWSYDRVYHASGEKSPFEPRVTLGVPTITPQDFRNAKNKWSEVLLI